MLFQSDVLYRNRMLMTNLGPVYTGPDKFGTGPRLSPDRPCVHTEPLGTGTVKVTYLVLSGSTCEKDPGMDLDRSRSRVNGKDWSHFGLD